MKKILIAVLALTLVFTMAISVGAKKSPSGKEYYDIKILVEGSGDATAEPYKIQKNTEGTTTLTATDKDGFFTRWIISGKYEIVSGSLGSRTLVILPKSDISATASFSKEEDWLNVTATAVGDGTASADPGRVKKGSGDTVTLVATDGSDQFIKWELHCDYDVISGDVKSRVMVIRPLTDGNAIAYFSSSGNGGTSNGSTSPKTGDTLLAVLGMMVVALGLGVFAFKKVRG